MAAFGPYKKRNFEEASILELEWDKSDSKQWDSLMQQTGRSNLMQSWAYGEAKSKTGSWKVNRVVILQSNKPVAIAQVLVKKFLFLKLFRLNRGPLFLKDTYLELQEPVICLLANQLDDLKKEHLLSFALEIPLSEKMLTMSEKQGIRQFKCRSWESIRLD